MKSKSHRVNVSDTKKYHVDKITRKDLDEEIKKELE